MPSARRSGLAAVAALACASALVPSAASAHVKAKAAQDNGSVASAPTLSSTAIAAGRAKFGAGATTAQILQAYWTPERMKDAKPIESAPFVTSAYQRFQVSQAAAQKNATMTLNRGARPAAPPAAQTLAAPDSSSEIASKPAAATSAYNPNFNYWQPTAYTSGKVFFNMNGGSYQCSATIVNSSGQDTVWTAGHCVNAGSGGQWATNWTFVPSYDTDLANPAPYGYWYANQLWSRTAWINSSDFTQDMGVAIMAPRNGWKIVAYFGGQGLRINVGKSVWENTFGYPAEYPFDGGHLMECWGTTSPEWSVLGIITSDTLKIPCDMTRGESGGGWLWSWNGNWGYLNGINSRIDQIVGPTVTFSPYFNNNAGDLYNTTAPL